MPSGPALEVSRSRDFHCPVPPGRMPSYTGARMAAATGPPSGATWSPPDQARENKYKSLALFAAWRLCVSQIFVRQSTYETGPKEIRARPPGGMDLTRSRKDAKGNVEPFVVNRSCNRFLAGEPHVRPGTNAASTKPDSALPWAPPCNCPDCSRPAKIFLGREKAQKAQEPEESVAQSLFCAFLRRTLFLRVQLRLRRAVILALFRG